jgi:hypothetical protein
MSGKPCLPKDIAYPPSSSFTRLAQFGVGAQMASLNCSHPVTSDLLNWQLSIASKVLPSQVLAQVFTATQLSMRLGLL